MKVSGSSELGTEHNRPAVLAVDDVEANLVALQALLEDMDCDVVLARSGNDALRHLLRREFAVVLLDVQMPGMDGYEVAHHARRNPSTRDVPIIFLTAANNSEGMVLRGYGSGAVDFLFKPLNPSILRSKVRVFLELRAAHRKIADAKTALERSNAELHSLANEKARLAERGHLCRLHEQRLSVLKLLIRLAEVLVGALEAVRQRGRGIGQRVELGVAALERELTIRDLAPPGVQLQKHPHLAAEDR